MPRKVFWPAIKPALAVATLILAATGASAATERILHSFDIYDGGNPLAGLIFDAEGNLYGTTSSGGPNGHGTVFRLSRVSGGGWTENVLYSFTGGRDGSDPGASLTFDAQGSLYGTTESGGAHDNGIVFQLTPHSGGKWKETVLHSFAGGPDGENPLGSLVFDSAGNLYGTTPTGGEPFGLGTVFKLAPVGGSWKETIIHRFSGGDGGNAPVAGLVFDAAGNLYGTTAFGGSAGCGGSGCGIVFQLKPMGKEKWTSQVLHRFSGGRDGMSPASNLIFDAADNLYGTTVAGGNSGCGDQFGCGTVFELSSAPKNEWKEVLIYRFKGGLGGASPRAGLALDTTGNLYGTTTSGGGSGRCGPHVGCGTVFELEPPESSGGKWQAVVLHRFNTKQDGIMPSSEPILDATGDIYGTTQGGGTTNAGIVFEITP
jgi:uncharacterized repeat protein (TIGR03803 family)